MTDDTLAESFAKLLREKKDALLKGERTPSGAALMLISIALKHPEVLQEAVA